MSFAPRPNTPTIDQMVEELHRLGWRRSKNNATTWIAPWGALFRGPYLAWCVATGKGYIYAK